MTVKDIVSEVRRLSFEDRILLLNSIAQSLREEIRKTRKGSVQRVRGMLRPNGPLPTDAELKEIYTQHFIEKYG